MGYIAVKGGETAIYNAERFLNFQRISKGAKLLEIDQIRDQLYFAVDRVMSEGSLYATDLAALAFKQAAGDAFEAAFILRSYRTTLPRIGYSRPINTENMRVVRRISAAFKEIPGGQILGPSTDYTLRLLNFELADEADSKAKEKAKEFIQDALITDPIPGTLPKIVDMLRQEGLLVKPSSTLNPKEKLIDVTREALSFPVFRSAQLQTLSRGEAGGMLALAYSNMRGYGSVHPVIGELRVGFLDVVYQNPLTDLDETIGEIKVTEAEVISRIENDGGAPKFSLGYGLTFGHNETKAIAMAVLDRALSSPESGAPSENAEFVLTHIDGIESVGFCNHYKLPHYVTFQSDLDRLRKIQTGNSDTSNPEKKSHEMETEGHP